MREIPRIYFVSQAQFTTPMKVFFAITALLALLSLSLSSAKKVFTVSPGESIQAAIELAQPGDTVEWTWVDNLQHNVASTASAQESFNSGLIQGQGTTWSYTFTEVGVNDYECTPHKTTTKHLSHRNNNPLL